MSSTYSSVQMSLSCADLVLKNSLVILTTTQQPLFV